MKKIHLSPDLSLPLDAVTQAMAIIARRGAGKTYAAMKLCEDMVAAGAQIVALDPVGVWWGLRLAADGKKKGLDIPVFGGLHGDIPIDAGMGAAIADLVVDKGISAVLDVSQFEHDTEKARFAADWANRFFYRKKDAPSAVHIFVEEAQEFVPQNPQRGEERMLHVFQRLPRLGRNFGIGITLISQRPQDINKKALSQSEVLIVLQTNGAHERKAIKEWVVDKGMDQETLDDIPHLPVGAAWVWSPQWLKILKRVKIGKKWTFDSSSTPEVGRRAAGRELAAVDLGEIRAGLAEGLKRVMDDDPKALKARIKDLEAAARRPAAPPPAPVKPQKVVEVSVLHHAHVVVLERSGEKLLAAADKIAERINTLLQEIRRAEPLLRPGRQPIKDYREPHQIGPPRVRHEPHPMVRSIPVPVPAPADGAPARLGAGELKMLGALALRHKAGAMTKKQLGLLSGYAPNGGTFRTYLPRIKAAGLVVVTGENVNLTDAGLQVVAGVAATAPQTAESVRDMWRRALGHNSGECKMFDALVTAYPSMITKEELGQRTGYAAAGGTFRTYLPRLKGLGLVNVQGDVVSAADDLFR